MDSRITPEERRDAGTWADAVVLEINGFVKKFSSRIFGVYREYLAMNQPSIYAAFETLEHISTSGAVLPVNTGYRSYDVNGEISTQ